MAPVIFLRHISSFLPKRIKRWVWNKLDVAYLASIFIDKYLGIDTQRINPAYTIRENKLIRNRDATGCQASSYFLLYQVSLYLKLTSNDVMVDLGCGTGRAIFFFATTPIKKVIGTEFNPDILSILKKNMHKYHYNNKKIKICNMDVSDYRFRDENILFIFNPFGEKTLKDVLNNLEQSLMENNRTVRIVYIYQPDTFAHIFMSKPWIKLMSSDILGNNVCVYEACLD